MCLTFKKRVKKIIWKIKNKYYNWLNKTSNEQIEKDHEEYEMLKEHFEKLAGGGKWKEKK